jgi:O-antigen biosynthesis protein
MVMKPPQPSVSISVSIIMKVWNAFEHVRLCAGTLLRNTDVPFELIVIDNGSQPEVVRFLRHLAAADSRVLLIENRENVGPGRANLQGAAQARANLLCLIDSDVLVPQGWLSRLLAVHARHPEVRMLTPMRYHQTIDHPFEPANSLEAWFKVKKENARLSPLRQFYAYSRGLSIDEFDRLMCSENPQELKVIECPPAFTGTCCALLDAQFVAGVGGVADTRFEGYGSEDVDLCWRIGENGGQVAETGAVYVHHYHHSSLIDNAIDGELALRTANQILYEKWQPRLIALAQAEILRSGLARDYLSAHFIFQPLSRTTSFIHDLRVATQRADIPDVVTWKPRREGPPCS